MAQVEETVRSRDLDDTDEAVSYHLPEISVRCKVPAAALN